jgi:RNA polymerase sigma-70 factor (ECF subfamily)
MRIEDEAERWRRLLELLAPLHDAAVITARRLSRSSSDGDDLYQEAVTRAFERLPSLRDETRFRAWFYAVLLSVHRTRSRRGFWRRFLPLDALVEAGAEPAGDDATVWIEERRRAERASRALATLPAVQREAVVLFDIEGFTVEEVAAAQNVSVSAVKSRLARGRARLRRHYERLGLGAGSDRSRSVNGSRRGVIAPIGAPLTEVAGAMPIAAPAVAGLSRKEVRDER